MNNKTIKILILSAGKGKRMESDLPKVLIPLHGKPMVSYVVHAVENTKYGKPTLIVGHHREMVMEAFRDSCDFAVQHEQLGTGHAVLSAKDACEGYENIVVLSGDQPFIKSETIEKLIEKHLSSGAKLTFTSTRLPDFTDGWHKSFLAFGRILRHDGEVVGIREYKDATDEEKEIKEVNSACYVFQASWLWENLEKIKNNNVQKEYYLTDLFQIASENGDMIKNIEIDPIEALGANTKEELEILENLSV